MKNIVTCLAISAALTSSALADPMLTGTPCDLKKLFDNEYDTITLRAHTQRSVEADEAKVTISVTAKAKKLKDALTKNGIMQQKITARLVAEGISTNAIKTANFSSYPSRFTWGDKPKEYTVSGSMVITAKDSADIRKVAGIVDTYEEVSFTGISFEVTDREAIRRRLIKEAIRKVQLQKTEYENLLDVKLSARSIGFPHGDFARKQVNRNRYVYSGKRSYSSISNQADPFADDARTPPDNRFAEQIISADVVMEFRFIPNDKSAVSSGSPSPDAKHPAADGHSE